MGSGFPLEDRADSQKKGFVPMIDVKKVQEEAESEVRDEQTKAAKEKIKNLLRRKTQAQQVLFNIEREIADAYAELGKGSAQ
jgi:hypothetical protein